MQAIWDRALDNLRNIARLAQCPTHQLRVLYPDSCVPELHYETRPWTSLLRRVTGDSRHGVFAALERTVDILLGAGTSTTPPGPEVVRQCLELDTTFRRGLRTLRQYYDTDLSIESAHDRILDRWSRWVAVAGPGA